MLNKYLSLAAWAILLYILYDAIERNIEANVGVQAPTTADTILWDPNKPKEERTLKEDVLYFMFRDRIKEAEGKK